MKKNERTISHYTHMKTISDANKKWLARKYVDPLDESKSKKVARLRKTFNNHSNPND
jgi:hypothetical protein